MPNTGWGAILTRTSLVNGVTAAFANWDNGTFTLPTLPNVDPTLLNGSGVVYVDRNSKGLVHSIGFSLERELPHGILLRARYGGKLSHGVPTNDLQDLNTLPLKYLSLGQLLSANINSPQAQAAGQYRNQHRYPCHPPAVRHFEPDKKSQRQQQYSDLEPVKN